MDLTQFRCAGVYGMIPKREGTMWYPEGTVFINPDIPPTPPPYLTLRLTFDNSVNMPIADINSLNDWNAYLNLPAYGTEFTNLNIAFPGVDVQYGSLYNQYVLSNPKGFVKSGWRVLTEIDWAFLMLGGGGAPVAGLTLKESGTDYWTGPNTDASNGFGFNARGTGQVMSGVFANIKNSAIYWAAGINFERVAEIDANYEVAYMTDSFLYIDASQGHAVRIRKNTTTLLNGETGTYIQNDGVILPTICINGIEYLACDLIESKYNDNSSITLVSNMPSWNSATEAMCYYAFNIDNAYLNQCITELSGGNLTDFIVTDTSSLMIVENINLFTDLIGVLLTNNRPLTEIPILSGLSNLKNLYIDYLPNISNGMVDVTDLVSLEKLEMQASLFDQTDLDSTLATLTSGGISRFSHLNEVDLRVLNGIVPTPSVKSDFIAAYPTVVLKTN